MLLVAGGEELAVDHLNDRDRLLREGGPIAVTSMTRARESVG